MSKSEIIDFLINDLKDHEDEDDSPNIAFVYMR